MTLARRALAASLLAALVVVLVSAGRSPRGAAPAGPAAAAAGPCDRLAAGRAALAGEFAEARAGETICLAPGDYGVFHGGAKRGVVTIRSRSGRSASMALALDGAENMRVDHVTVTSAEIASSRDVTVSHSRFTGLAVIHAGQIANANIVFDGNAHVGVDTCAGCFQGRVHVDPAGREPSGVTIGNSLFDGGNSDGVRADADGVRVIGNEFRNFPDEGPFHTDPIQIYGGTRVLVRGNRFHDNAVSAQIMMANGGEQNVVEDNVIAGDGYTWAMTWLGDHGSVIRHNTFVDGACNFGKRCGTINLGDPTGRGTVVRDNVLGGISGGGAGVTADHNLSPAPIPGPANITAVPTYSAGGGQGTGRFRLAPGSAGVGDASDGADRGVR
jgi:hypothetical protein